jgi:hypothetical protein
MQKLIVSTALIVYLGLDYLMEYITLMITWAKWDERIKSNPKFAYFQLANIVLWTVHCIIAISNDNRISTVIAYCSARWEIELWPLLTPPTRITLQHVIEYQDYYKIDQIVFTWHCVVLQTCSKLNKLKFEDAEVAYMHNEDIQSYIHLHGHLVLYYTLRLMYEVKSFTHEQIVMATSLM